MDSSIRLAKLADISSIITLEEQSFESDQLSRERLRYFIQKAKAMTLVATHHALIVGYAILLTPKHPKPARLYSIAVDAAYQHQGIGRQLLEKAMQKAKHLGYRSIRLEVRQKHPKTIAFYQKHGFEIISTLPNYYANGDSGLRMVNYLVHHER